MLELLGWAGSSMFCFCALPQCIKAYKTKSVGDLSWAFILMWVFGEIMTFSYVLIKNINVGEYQTPLLTNYVLNFLMVCYLVYAKMFYKGENNV